MADNKERKLNCRGISTAESLVHEPSRMLWVLGTSDVILPVTPVFYHAPAEKSFLFQKKQVAPLMMCKDLLYLPERRTRCLF